MASTKRISFFKAGASALALLGGGASAQTVWVGSDFGTIQKGDAHGGGFEFVQACGGPVNSMATGDGKVFVADTNGGIYVVDVGTSQIAFAYVAENDALSMVKAGPDLILGGSDTTILRVDALTGAAVATLQAPFFMTIDAMSLQGSSLVLGSASTIFAEGDSMTGNFTGLGACGGVIQSLARRGDELYLGDANGNVYRYDFAAHQLGYAFTVASDARAMVVDGSHLLIGGSNGKILRVNSVGGALVTTFDLGFPISALAIEEPALEPGSGYCFGTVCPCGNVDAEGGCTNSTGHGAVLGASGTTSVAADDFALRVEFLPANALSRMYMSQVQNQIPFGDGVNCAGGGGYPAFRFAAKSSGPGGVLEAGPGIAGMSGALFGAAGTIGAGSTWNFQAWYRNPNGPCGSNFNTSSAYAVTFTN